MRGIALALTCIAAAGCTTWPGPRQAVSSAPPQKKLPRAFAQSVGGWTVKVSVEVSNTSPIAVSVEPARPAPRNDAQPWVQHELVFENRGGRLVRFGDTRASRFIGPAARRRVLAADEGCGYVPQGDGTRLEAGACALYLDAPTVEPDASISRTITLFKGLPGMEPLVPGRYVFEKVIRFRVGHELPTEGTGRTAVIRLIYEIQPVSR
jgi:hypothetical protein